MKTLDSCTVGAQSSPIRRGEPPTTTEIYEALFNAVQAAKESM
jgi:hypothetical protein